MINISLLKKIILILLVSVILLNVVAFFFLPDRISLQINANWDIHGSTVPKLIFLLLGPIVTVGAYLYAKFSPNNEKQALFLSIIAFAGSIVTIVFNLIVK